MEFGIAFANTLQFTERDGLVELARSAEAAGFDSLWTVEHVIYPDGYESEYPYDRSGKMAADAFGQRFANTKEHHANRASRASLLSTE